MRKPVELCLVLTFTIFRLCCAQVGICYVLTSTVSTQSIYLISSYQYYTDCSDFGWGWDYCSAIGYTSTLSYFSYTSYVAQLTCCTGYQQVGKTQTCADINECASNGGLGLCQQVCTNTVGSYYCSCMLGYAMSSDGTSCHDINECTLYGGVGLCQQNCTNTAGSFICSCQNGYLISADNKHCLAIEHFPNAVSISKCITSTMDESTVIITPTATLSNDVIMVSPSLAQSTQNNLYVQVRFLNAVNCASYMVPAFRKLLSQSLNENVNEYCKYNLSMENAEVICYDITRVTVRGAVGLIQLPCLKEWVVAMATTLNLQGTLIQVDNDCPVQIQSLDDPECPIGNVSALKQTAVNDITGLTVGVAVEGFVAVIAILSSVVLIAVLLIRFKKSNKIQTHSSPLYGVRIPEHFCNATTEGSLVCEVSMTATRGNTQRDINI